MDIKLKRSLDSANTINKKFSDEILFTECKLKSDTEIINPTILIQSNTFLNYNYAEIPEFNRSYFINNITLFPRGLYELELKCDVLESFKTDILNSKAWITQNTNINNYYDDGNYLSEVKKEITIYKSDVTITRSDSIIMITAGGV